MCHNDVINKIERGIEILENIKKRKRKKKHYYNLETLRKNTDDKLLSLFTSIETVII